MDVHRMLGLDTATARTTVAVADGDEVVAERAAPGPAAGRPDHSRVLLGLIAETVAESGGWESIGSIATGIGPGTYTGLRIGVATARALAQARALPLIGVDSLAALARGIPAAGANRPRLALIDARRDEVFAGLYGGDGEELWAPLVTAPEALAKRLSEAGVRPLAAGDGSLRFRAQLESAGVEILPDADPAHHLTARHVCALAADLEPGLPTDIRPAYLRRPDAEVWREQRDRSHRAD